jgi:hypothetical protein
LNKYSLSFSNTRHTWSIVPRFSWPRLLLNRMRYLFKLFPLLERRKFAVGK